MQSLKLSDWWDRLPEIRQHLKNMKLAKLKCQYAAADAIRDFILSLDTGMRITQDRKNKITLWHFPNPPFAKQFHFANYGEFIANSEESL